MRSPASERTSERGVLDPATTAASGLMLGCVICLLEMVQQPLADAHLEEVYGFLAGVAPMWGLAGLGWSFTARWAEPRLSPGGFILAWLVISVVLTFATRPFDLAVPITAGSVPLAADTRAAHVLWVNLFYGSIYLSGYVGSRRAVYSRRILARVQRARDESAAALEDSRLDLFRRQLQPKIIVDSLGALRGLYRTSPEQADALVDELVGFLRPAVRSLGGGSATLAGEVDLVRRYLRLRSLTAREVETVVATSKRAPPDTPFPTQLLMPLVESLCIAGATVHLRSEWNGGAYRLTLRADQIHADTLTSRLRQRIVKAFPNGASAIESKLVEAAGSVTWTLETADRTGAERLMEISA